MLKKWRPVAVRIAVVASLLALAVTLSFSLTKGSAVFVAFWLGCLAASMFGVINDEVT